MMDPLGKTFDAPVPREQARAGDAVEGTESERSIAVYLGPGDDPVLAAAIEASGGRLVPLEDAEAAVWTSLDPASWHAAGAHERLRWVQLPSAGVESWIAAGAVTPGLLWTSARGASAATVAEHALGLLLAVRHRFIECARATSWERVEGRPLRGSTALIVGCGAIGEALIPMLTGLGVESIAVTRSGRLVGAAIESHDQSALPALWPRADIVVVAAPATASTHHIVDAAALAAMPAHATLVNVARGTLVDTDALTEALQAGELGGAGLDVTDPEPLPAGHPLWSLPNALITPHVANPEIAWKANVARRVTQNLARFRAGEELVGAIDLHLSY